MSSRGLFSAVSGAMAQMSRLDTIANNLANVNTTSFKKDQQVFSEYLSAYEKPEQLIRCPRVPASIESFYDMQGGDTAYVNPAGTYTNFTQGGLRSTGSPLDLAIDGKGFFEVMGPDGKTRWTRSGGFQIDNKGLLVTREGYPVLKEGQGAPQGRTIHLNSGSLTVTGNGDIFDGGVSLGRIALVKFANPDDLQKIGNSFYTLKRNATSTPVIADETRVHQGYLETSNVNVVQEMTDMIAANRVFDATQKAIKAHDEMDDKLINQVGKV